MSNVKRLQEARITALLENFTEREITILLSSVQEREISWQSVLFRSTANSLGELLDTVLQLGLLGDVPSPSELGCPLGDDRECHYPLPYSDCPAGCQGRDPQGDDANRRQDRPRGECPGVVDPDGDPTGSCLRCFDGPHGGTSAGPQGACGLKRYIVPVGNELTTV